jgi:tetratricopeptide (TPR) repeat protein
MPNTPRLEQLLKLLEREPNDTFLIYGLALEHKNAGDLPKAIELLNRVIQLDGGYCYAYHQKGLAYEKAGDIEAAKQAYRDGIAAAVRKGDSHAKGEIEAALMEVG